MHRIGHIEICNFRACRNVSLPLEGFTPLVGQNNAGKSTILEAIQWVLKPSAMSAADFFEPNSPIIVSARIDGIDEQLLARIPEQKHRKAIEPYCRNSCLWIRVVAAGSGAKSISREVWDVETCKGEEIPSQWRAYPTGLPQAVSTLLPDPIFVEAMDDIGEDLGKAKAGTTIKGLLDEIMAPILETHTDLKNALDSIKNILTKDGANRSCYLQSFDTEATDALSQFFPGLALDIDLQMVDVKEFFKAGDLHVTETATGDRRRFDQIGTGAQRAIQMALIRYLAGTPNSNQDRSARRLILIDEPEIYLHPEGVRRLRWALSQLAATGFQVVFATHSPLMLSRENAADTVIVKMTKDAGVTTQKPLRSAVNDALDNAQSQSRVLFELGNLADIYFSDRVVLCEGKTDRRLLPLAYERLYGRQAELDQITFISLGSCADIPKALPVLHSMGINAFAVADLDFGYTHARSGGLLDKDADDLRDVKHVLAGLASTHGFTLNGNGLPQKDKNSGWEAADIWALLAGHTGSAPLLTGTHNSLKQKGVWIWCQGCIEQITGWKNKGEDAIIEQEEHLQSLSMQEIESQMLVFKEFFEWVKS